MMSGSLPVGGGSCPSTTGLLIARTYATTSSISFGCSFAANASIGVPGREVHGGHAHVRIAVALHAVARVDDLPLRRIARRWRLADVFRRGPVRADVRDESTDRSSVERTAELFSIRCHRRARTAELD